MAGDKQKSPEEQWEELRTEFMQRIDAIDKATPWREREPAWWLHMMKARRAASFMGGGESAR